jgi:predicted glycoside hydrolase/deacetylase ChbG (UPF0249 family)
MSCIFKKMKNISIIINADDLGYSKKVNSEIARFAGANLISSVSVLANGPAIDDALTVLKDHPKLSVGAHLNITEFNSLHQSSIFKDYLIVDELNTFTGNVKHRKHISPLFTRAILNDIYLEWERQVSKLLDMGLRLTHLDSHNMVHYWNALLPIVKQIQKKFNIKIVRMKDVKPLSFYGIYNNNLPKKTPPLLKELNNCYWNAKLKYYAPKTVIVDHVFSYNSLYQYLSTGSKCPKSGVFEIVVHPGLDYMEYFENENKLVEERRLEYYLPQHSLISFRNLI